jgi:hypothetical protein
MILRLLTAAALALGLSGCMTTPQTTACAPEQGLDFVCGTGAMEDVAAIPGTPWLIGGNLNVGTPARLRLIDRSASTVVDLATDFAATAQRAANCPGPPDPARWSVSGLALDGSRLLAINHGDRMAVELFALDLSGTRPSLRWQGCAMMPPGTQPNALTPDGQGGFYVVSFHNPADPQPWAHMARGEPTGSVWHWRPESGFAQVVAGPLVGGNGIALSPDGSTLWISAWGAGQLVALDLASGARRVFALPFLPDNLHFAADGALLVAGQRADVLAIGACGPRCPQLWVVARVDPVSGAVTVLLDGAGSTAIDYAAGVREVDGQLWVTMRSDGRIGRFAPGQ